MALTITVRAEATGDELSLTFDMPRVFIGRGEGSDLRLPDPSVSLRHASIRQRGHEYVIIDEGSTNGTALGSVLLPPQSPRVLRSGELFRLGRVWLEVKIDPLATARATPATTKALALDLVTRGLATQGEDAGPKLVVVSGPDEGKTLALTDAARRYVLGRAREVDLPLDDPETAFRHVEIGLKGEHLLVRDLGSKAALLEGAALGPTDVAWRSGQTLAMGRNTLVFEYPAAEALAELSRCADEPMRPEDAPPPPVAEDETPSTTAAPEPTPVEDDASRPLRPQRAATPAPESGWSLTDGLVFVFGAFVLVLSVVGFFWLIRR
ncbi:FHA domain-containing protein [Polyangium sp. 6x1]|uniref:FHA domain-containing protein n=1 Tax=Polyangium sp. 6x1 TaxID=3042689 RepID=UPI0024831189|nr:FHA domain-containing protein [Polyangium sp. 6x1]MDI1443812.1 FHA domain-containing protein [Polyangium sp. 6x1]